MVYTVFEKAQSSKIWYLLCFGRLSRAKYAMYGVFEGSAEQKHDTYNIFQGTVEQRHSRVKSEFQLSVESASAT